MAKAKKPATQAKEERQAAYLDALSKTANRTYACKVAGITPATRRQWKSREDDWAQREQEAAEQAVDVLLMAAWKRATADNRPSDTLLIFLLKSLDRERFGDRYNHDHGGKSEGPAIKFEIVSTEARSEDD